MRSAPAVSVLCTGGSLWRSVLWLLPALTSGVFVYWAALHATLGQDRYAGWAEATGLGAFALAAWAARRHRPPAARLTWDGASWTCDGLPVRLQVMVDTAGSWMLLRLKPVSGMPAAAMGSTSDANRPPDSGPTSAGQTVWLAVARSDAAATWHALRAAVYCPAPHAAPIANPRQPP
jgi:hypothetical protein